MENYVIDLDLIKKFKNGDDKSFNDLFIKYKPIVNKIWRQYYFNDIEIDDWYQESRIVMLKIVERFNIKKGTSFGNLYKQSLKNHLFDILRKSKAKKRLPLQKKVSFNANEDYYNNYAEDYQNINPEFALKFDIVQKKLYHRCSKFEREILVKISGSYLEEDDYKLVKFKQINNLDDNKYRNCCSRIKHKLKIILQEENILPNSDEIDYQILK
ncbi:hypothetical protein MOO46_00070 [Apilactobacillus apisilvae]|uniref:RNA polymerase sigma-70 region 2 domain-containing protein n=1 Tax=Apilactobacillus apisilvae TaxID=2923364 RepID=A0ABY4PHT2_9LACO|nr:hypothetical protein [Apilactobacillus apisilvae]UQS85041.1 hypothetical protein MOO46_00070 [Apilactobacillus apisilvae]